MVFSVARQRVPDEGLSLASPVAGHKLGTEGLAYQGSPRLPLLLAEGSARQMGKTSRERTLREKDEFIVWDGSRMMEASCQSCWSKRDGGLTVRINSLLIGAGVLVVLLLPSASVAQVDNTASRTADSYLRAVNTIEMPESKRVIARAQWLRTPFSDHSFTNLSTISEEMMPTGIKEVQGYRRLMHKTIVNGAGVPLRSMKYVLVLFKDRASQQWKVLALRAGGTDLEFEASAACKNVDTNKTTSAHQDDYVRCGYSLLLAGKIEQARTSFRTALSLEPADVAVSVSPAKRKEFEDDINEYLDVIAGITGGR